MGLTLKQRETIKGYLIEKIRQKLIAYNPETSSMPFHFRLLGKNRMALFSFIHSVNTTLGTSIFEQIAKIIAEPRSKQAIGQYKGFEGYICNEAVLKIDCILRELRSTARRPNKRKETQEIISVVVEENRGKKLKKRVDLFVETQNGIEYYFEIKTAKPNIDGFTAIKKQLLDWIAMRTSVNPNVKIKTILAIPYNPYEPKPYERWTLQGLFDLKQEVLVGAEFWNFLGGKDTYELKQEVLVGAEFWNFLGGKDTYEDLLEVFEKAGLELYGEIEDKMNEIGEK